MSFNPSKGGSYRYNPITDQVERIDDVAPAAPIPAPEPEPVKSAPKPVTVKPPAVMPPPTDITPEK